VIDLLRFVRNVGSRNYDRRLAALKIAADRLIPDFRLTWHQMDWWHDSSFNAYLERFGERKGFNTHRRWMLWQLLRLVRDVPGNTAECGVFEGSSSWLICSAIEGSGRFHHLFDSFEGLSVPEKSDGSHWRRGDLAAPQEVVAKNLHPFASMIIFHKGWIPARFCDVSDEKFAFVHIDVDLRQPTLESMKFFYPRLSPGGVLVCDDYACTTCPGATASIDEFLRDKPEKMIGLDAGGGFLIKGTAVETPKPLRAPDTDG
jgi:O-methyltransferase